MSSLYLLLWKNFILHKRKWLATLLEIFLPCLALLILLFVRQQVQSENYPNATHWSSFDVARLPDGLEIEYSQWLLAYTPDSTDIKTLMESIITTLEGVTGLLAFPNEASMETFFASLVNSTVRQTLAGIVFSSDNITASEASSTVEYKLRFPYKLRQSFLSAYRDNPFRSNNNWLTNFMYPLVPTTGPRDSKDNTGGLPGYYREGFLGLQNAIDRGIIEFISQKEGSKSRSITDLQAQIEFQRTPYPPYLKDNFILVIQNQLPFLVVLAFMFASLNIVKNIVYEKEKRLKESLKMMGISSITHWISWFITYSVICTISIIFMVICMKIYVPPNGCIVNKSEPTVLFLFLWLYSCAVIAFCFTISVFFKSANAGAAAGGIIFFASFLPYNYMRNRYESYSWGEKLATSLVPNIAMCLGSRLIGQFEGENIGVQWNNIAMGANVDEPFSMVHVLFMLIIDTFLYSFLAWYIESVFPGEYGVPKPWYFLFQKRFWCNRCDQSKSYDSVVQDPFKAEDNYRLDHADYFQEEPTNVKPGVQVRGLTKVFGRGNDRRVAVNSLNMNMYPGEITVLLGHNGAGKTTTMAMLTGFIPPTSGTAIIGGYDIRTDSDKVRKSLGLCPQHDVLFDHLTVLEHLTFFAKLKGMKGSALHEEIYRMLTRVHLTEKKHVLSSNLSGGMRRRLSIAIALIGGSQVIILDEPTSGLDPDARRDLWTLLQQERPSRTMLLTTHFMDEADILGDRVAIMAAGQVQCYGTPLFLKNKYGADYHLTLVKSHDCNEQVLFQLIQQHIPDYRIESNISDELDILLPAASSHLFKKLFIEIEERKDYLGIRNYGVSITTMEEVFLKVGNYQEDREAQREETLKEHQIRLEQQGSHSSTGTMLRENNLAAPEESYGDTLNIYRPLDKTSTDGVVTSYEHVPEVKIITEQEGKVNSGIYLFIQQFGALLMKRLICFYRNKWMTISQMVIPVAFTIIGLVILRTVPIGKTLSPLTLNLDKFGVINLPYTMALNESLTPMQRDMIQRFLDLFRSRPKTNVLPIDVKEYSFEEFLLSVADRDIFRFDQQYILASVFNSTVSKSLNWRAYFNNQPYHSPAILQNFISNALLHYVRDNSSVTISTINYPFPKTSDDKLNDLIMEEGLAFTVALNLVFGMSFLAGTIATFLIRERNTRSKHLQYLSGVMSISYWFSTFLWDLVNFLLPSVFVVIVFVGFNEPAYTENGRAAIVLLLLMTFAFSVIPMMYLLSHFFSVPSTGLVWLVVFNILSGSITLITVNILRIPQLDLQGVSDTLNWIFLSLLPNYCLGQGVADIYINHLFLDICLRPETVALCDFGVSNPCCLDNCGDYCAEYNTNYLGWKSSGIGRMLAFLVIQGLIFFFILFAKESSLAGRIQSSLRKIMNSLTHKERSSRRPNAINLEGAVTSSGELQTDEEDDDVHAERLKLQTTNLQMLRNMYCLILSEVTKRYGSLTAVDHISCSVSAGKCFGLLGINGAGKTTTFKMMTGDLALTSGDIYINGINLRENRRAAQRTLGYCPQFDALIEELTGRELLTLFSRLRGIRPSQINNEVTQLLKKLNLCMYADIRCGKYSGGNKRKLSTAIALVGSPSLVCLDEPTTGMDPVARRQLWNTLTQYRDNGNTLILTSHSMEECEALCTDIAIMVNGQFQCLGTCQYLKAKFAEGYTLLIQVRYPSVEEGEPIVKRALEFVESELGVCELKDRHQGHMHLYLPKNTQLSWAHIFGTMEDNVTRLDVVYYSVTQTSLEQVFLGFARNQKPPLETTTTCCSCWGRSAQA